MDYKGRYNIFDNSDMKTYVVRSRKNKLSAEDFFKCEELASSEIIKPDEQVKAIARDIVNAYKDGKPVIIFTGAHSIKNGISPLYIDLMRRGIISLFATNVAGTIHDFETALQGETSEDVREVLARGEFGMAFETGAILNQTYIESNKLKLGYGESLGLLYNDSGFRKSVLDAISDTAKKKKDSLLPYDGFKFDHFSVMAAAYKYNIPSTVHASVGTDIIDQHENFEPGAKGACSGRDFLIYTEEIGKLTDGGVILNIGSAVIGPEVLLKAVSMVTNVGRKPNNITCADFDIKPFVFDDNVRDESQYYYYLRDQKSVATRIPKVFGGQAYYVEGNHSHSVTSLYQYIRREINARVEDEKEEHKAMS